jgi:hypothetical protein
LLLTIFNFDTPVELKARENELELNKVMSKIYAESAVKERSDGVKV